MQVYDLLGLPNQSLFNTLYDITSQKHTYPVTSGRYFYTGTLKAWRCRVPTEFNQCVGSKAAEAYINILKPKLLASRLIKNLREDM